MQACIRIFFLTIILLSQSFAAFGGECLDHGDEAAAVEHCSTGSEPQKKTTEQSEHETLKDHGSTHDDCSIDCESCGGLSILPTCDRLASVGPAQLPAAIQFANPAAPGFTGPLFRPPIYS